MMSNEPRNSGFIGLRAEVAEHIDTHTHAQAHR